MITTTQFDDVVKNATVLWKEGFDEVPLVAKQLYDVRQVKVMTSEHSSFSGYTFAERKQEGQNYTYGNINQGYTLNLSQLRIGLMDAITWEMRKFDKYREIEKKMRGLGRATAKRMDIDATHQFTFGMSAASYTNRNGETIATTSADGQNTFDTDHTITGGSTTYSNLITTAFSRAGLEEAEQLFTRFVDDSGNKLDARANTIVTTDDPSIVNSVKEFLKSTLIPDEANNATNVYSGKYKHLILPYFATTAAGAVDTDIVNYWMLVNTQADNGPIMEISEYPTFTPPSKGGNGEEFETDDWKFKSSACYDLGVLGWQFGVGSTGATS